MNPWILPLIKLVTANIEPIISATKPLFTKKKAAESQDPIAVLQQQIAELQTATADATSQVQQLAEQLKETIAVIEKGARHAEAKDRAMRRLAQVALGASLAATLLSLAAFVRFWS